MAVTFHTQDCGFRLRGKRDAAAWLRRVAEAEGRKVGSVSVVFCSDAAMLALNRDYLAHDYLTDIITFDYSEGRLISGDLMIGVETVRANAATFGTAFGEELMRVMVHGILHLCGHGDKTPFEEAEMRKLEDKYLTLR